MCSSIMASQYLLPGELDNNSKKIVHTHGINRNQPLNSSKQFFENNFLSIPCVYEPKEKDLVLGIVIVRAPDLFVIDINSVESAVLPTTSFDPGRLPTRNAMNRLSVVFAHVVRADPWTQAELSCQSIESSRKKKEFGLLEQGHIIRCSLRLCEKLQDLKLINKLTSLVKNFRMRIAANGFVWYATDDTINTMIAIKNVIYEHEYENNIDQLIEFFNTKMKQLEQQDNSLIQVKQQKRTVKPDTEIKEINQTQTTGAIARLLDNVIKSVLNRIIDQIENKS